jgi:hypothetical protein
VLTDEEADLELATRLQYEENKRSPSPTKRLRDTPQDDYAAARRDASPPKLMKVADGSAYAPPISDMDALDLGPAAHNDDDNDEKKK